MAELETREKIADLISLPEYGSQAALSRFLGCTPQAVGQFVQQGYLPLEQARKIAAKHPDFLVRGLVDPTLVDVLCGGTGTK